MCMLRIINNRNNFCIMRLYMIRAINLFFGSIFGRTFLWPSPLGAGYQRMSLTAFFLWYGQKTSNWYHHSIYTKTTWSCHYVWIRMNNIISSLKFQGSSSHWNTISLFVTTLHISLYCLLSNVRALWRPISDNNLCNIWFISEIFLPIFQIIYAWYERQKR